MKDVKDYEEFFSVTEDGRIFSKRTNKFLSLTKNKSGYMCFTTRFEGRDSKAVCLRVHRLVASTYIDGYVEGYVVNHKDGDKANNHKDNLEWCSQQDNVIHAYETGLTEVKILSENKLSKLTDSQVKEIRSRYSPRCPINGVRALGREFGISHKNLLKYLK